MILIISHLNDLQENELIIFQDVGETEEEGESQLQEEVMDLSALVGETKIPEEMITRGRKLSLEKKTVLREISNLAILIEVAINLQTITIKIRNLVEVISHTKVEIIPVEDHTVVVEIIPVEDLTTEEEIIQVEDLTTAEEIIQVEDHTVVEEIILEEDLTVVEESQPTKMAVDEVNRIIPLINLEIRAIETVIENHHLKDSLV